MTPAEFRAARKRLGLTQADLADALGMSRSQVSRMEHGAAPIVRRTVLALEAMPLSEARRYPAAKHGA